MNAGKIENKKEKQSFVKGCVLKESVYSGQISYLEKTIKEKDRIIEELKKEIHIQEVREEGILKELDKTMRRTLIRNFGSTDTNKKESKGRLKSHKEKRD